MRERHGAGKGSGAAAIQAAHQGAPLLHTAGTTRVHGPPRGAHVSGPRLDPAPAALCWTALVPASQLQLAPTPWALLEPNRVIPSHAGPWEPRDMGCGLGGPRAPPALAGAPCLVAGVGMGGGCLLLPPSGLVPCRALVQPDSGLSHCTLHPTPCPWAGWSPSAPVPHPARSWELPASLAQCLGCGSGGWEGSKLWPAPP